MKNGVNSHSTWSSGVIQPSSATSHSLQINFYNTQQPFDQLHPTKIFGSFIGQPAFDFLEVLDGTIYTAGFVELPTHYVVLYAANVEQCRHIVSRPCSPLHAEKPILYPLIKTCEAVALRVGHPKLKWWGALYGVGSSNALYSFIDDPFQDNALAWPKTILGCDFQRSSFDSSWVLSGLLPALCCNQNRS